MKLRDTPIQRKLLSVILLTAAVVLTFTCSIYIILETNFYKENVKRNAATLGEVIALNSSAAVAFDDPNDANEILSAIAAERNMVLAALYKENKTLFTVYPANADTSLLPDKLEHNLYYLDGEVLHGFSPVRQNGQQLGTLYIRGDISYMYWQMQRFALIGLALIATSLLIAYLLSKILQRAISQPILALEDTAKSISEQGDYSVRAIKRGNDEVGALTDAFNQMLDRIKMQNDEIISFNQRLEQKVVERTSELQQQKDFVETIINSSVDLISVFDTGLNFMMLNKKTREFYNGHGDLLGKNLFEVFPFLRNTEMHDYLDRALRGEHVYASRYRSKVVPHWYENFYIPLRDGGSEIYGVLLIGHDITSIVEASEKLEKVNAELLKSNRDLEQFAYVASHDLQEPLRKIQTFSQLMSERSDDPEQTKRYQEKINQSSARMKQLIQDMLNFSRVSNSEDAFVPTDLNEVLENLIIDFELLLKEKEAVIHYPKLPVIPGVPLQISQLFANIINNSLKYTENKPVIEITCHVLTKEEGQNYPRLDKHIPHYVIKFKDNGIGFEPQYSEQIFAIFQRLHGKQSYSGTGIGLALCKKIVENHNGIIYAEGEVNKGATFTIILPGA